MPSSVTNEMLQLFVSDYMLNSATFALFKGGLLKYSITDQVHPLFSLNLPHDTQHTHARAHDTRAHTHTHTRTHAHDTHPVVAWN
jgi:hypothetical protein